MNGDDEVAIGHIFYRKFDFRRLESIIHAVALRLIYNDSFTSSLMYQKSGCIASNVKLVVLDLQKQA